MRVFKIFLLASILLTSSFLIKDVYSLLPSTTCTPDEQIVEGLCYSTCKDDSNTWDKVCCKGAVLYNDAIHRFECSVTEDKKDMIDYFLIFVVVLLAIFGLYKFIELLKQEHKKVRKR